MANEPNNNRVLTCYYRIKPGGFCRRLLRAINALLTRGHTVHYLSVTPFPISHPNCHHHRFPWPAYSEEGLVFWTWFHFAAPLILLYLGIRYRVTHSFAFGHTYGFLLQPLRLLTRIPLALFLRADAIENHRLKCKARIVQIIDSLIEGLAICGTRLYCVSTTLSNNVLARHRHIRPTVTAVIPNDIPPWNTERHPPRRISRPLRLATVGIIEARKNHVLLLKVMARLDPQDVRLDIYGIGIEDAALRATVTRQGLNDRIHFMGWVDDVKELWSQIDVLLFPSLHEGAPNAVLEAIAAGVVVLASDIPEHREILSPLTLYSPVQPDTWCNTLNMILLDPAKQLTEMRAAQERVTKRLRFNWDKRVVEAILSESR
jgi:glycosyltransferase involved in cell wall biosynthesis